MEADIQQQQQEQQQRKLLELAAERLVREAQARTTSSSYDFVKIKVRLGSQLEHYYILSRFLLSRMLTVITLPQHKAVRVALDVKKHLVDHGRLDITQDELEEVLFALLRQRGYGDEYVRRYQMVTLFFQQKRPLIILIAGSACTGKSSLAQQLASRLNLPNVLQTDVLYELLRASGIGDLPADPLWRRALPPGVGLVPAFQHECGTIRRALDGDLCKCIRDGKSIIIEGLHIDPGLFLLEFGDSRGGVSPTSSGGGLDLASGDPRSSSSEVPVPVVEPMPISAAGAAAEVQAQMAALQMPAAANGSAAMPPAAAATAAEGQQASSRTAAAEAAAAAAGLLAQQNAAAAAVAADSAGGQPDASSAARRTASFGDAVQRLHYGSLHRLHPSWKEREQAGSSQALLRPRSARLGSSSSMERGQAIFMLKSPEAEDCMGAESGGEAGSLPALLPSPRLAPCISLPPVWEQGGRDAPQRCHSLPSAARQRSTRPSESNQWASHQKPVPEEAAMECFGSGDTDAAPVAVAAMPPGDEQPPAAHAPSSPLITEQADVTDASVAGAVANQQQQQQQQRQHSSVAAADAAAAAAAGAGPVFVPICLSVDDGEYDGMLDDWLAHQQRALGDGGAEGVASPAGSQEAALRLRLLQEHLRQYGASGVPVVDTSDMAQALDSMHAYVLQCIELALI